MHLIVQLGCLSLLTTGVLGQDVTVSAPARVPTSASAVVDESFLNLMFETTSWATVAHDSMSQTLIQNLVKKAGAPLIIRVGGTSGDQASYNASQTKANNWPYDTQHNLTVPVILGKPFADGFGKINGVRYILQVPLANSTVKNTVQFTKDLLQSIDMSMLEAIEVGNEPDLYTHQNYRGKPKRESYSEGQYVNELKTYINEIIKGVPSVPQGAIFHVGSLSDKSSWKAEKLYQEGLANVAPGRIKAFAQHYYQTKISSGQPLRATLLNHADGPVKWLNGSPQATLDYFRSAGIKTPMIISEAGSALGAEGGSYERGIDAVLGSALWEVDWALLAMSRGVSRVNMNQCNGCNFASWWAGDDEHRGIFSQYYGLVMLADWLGLAGASDGGFRVASLYDGKYPNVSPYAGYVDGKLDRLVVIDLNEWNMTETTSRVQRSFVLDVGKDIKTAELRRLTGKGTDATAQDGAITYAGMQYTPETPEGKEVGKETESVAVKDGKATFKMVASEAVLLTLHR